ncbi:MAG: hypothetical protein WAT39_08235 [Planctomycetota bacterium]
MPAPSGSHRSFETAVYGGFAAGAALLGVRALIGDVSWLHAMLLVPFLAVGIPTIGWLLGLGVHYWHKDECSFVPLDGESAPIRSLLAGWFQAGAALVFAGFVLALDHCPSGSG